MREEFKPGDTVVIREWDDMQEEYGLNEYGNIECACHFTTEMKDFCGIEMVIKSVGRTDWGNTVVEFVSPVEGMNMYYFSTDMIRRVDETVHQEIDIDAFMSIIANG